MLILVFLNLLIVIGMYLFGLMLLVLSIGIYCFYMFLYAVICVFIFELLKLNLRFRSGRVFLLYFLKFFYLFGFLFL